MPINNWIIVIILLMHTRLLSAIARKQERILKQMASAEFQNLLTEIQSQGAQLDKIEAEVTAGNASVITAEEVQQLKDGLAANKAKLQKIDEIHPDTPTAPPSDETGDSTGDSSSSGDAGSSGSTGDESSSGETV